MGKDKKNNYGAKKLLGSILSNNIIWWAQKMKLREINSLHHLVTRSRSHFSQPKQKEPRVSCITYGKEVSQDQDGLQQ